MKPIFKFQNKDKDSWQSQPDAKTGVGFRRGSRCMLIGAPNSGKTCVCFNKIVDSDPPYDIIYIYQASSSSEEYSSIKYVKLDSIQDLPPQNEIPKDKKILVILEDMDTISKKDMEVLDVWFRFSASHLGVCMVLVAQNFYSIPVALRRKLDCWIMFLHGADLSPLRSIPIPKEDREALVNYFRKHGERHSFITIDLGIEDRYIFNNHVILNL
jgi:hypothetical protein